MLTTPDFARRYFAITLDRAFLSRFAAATLPVTVQYAVIPIAIGNSKIMWRASGSTLLACYQTKYSPATRHLPAEALQRMQQRATPEAMQRR
jgi:hypothetical protein